ncbi:PTS sugar transporter subunit IIBC [Chryseobacterium gleum]|uniref:PTS sugar transporter subunit IIBC n=1 Tax=Chryseobacterium gleum TaxID=250 RepID=UPI00289FDC87|nr:PTS sugar transporter subunit IIBC [Chryseobacterium gleum]
MNFINKNISIEQAITLLAKKGIQVDHDEMTIILDFLYLMAKNYKKPKAEKISKP